MPSIIDYLASQPTMQVLRSLLIGDQGKHVRQLANQLNLSPSGVMDIIRRLRELGVLKEVKNKNKKCYSLKLNQPEILILNTLFAEHEISLIKQRTIKFSKHAVKKLTWMDESYLFYKNIKKRKKNDATKNT